MYRTRSPWDHINRGRYLYTYCRRNTNNCELVLGKAHYHAVLISQHCKFVLVNFMYSRNLIFYDTSESHQYPGRRAGLVFLCSSRLPEDDNPVPKHVGILTLLMNCTS